MAITKKHAKTKNNLCELQENRKNNISSINYLTENNVRKIVLNNFIIRKELKMLQHNSKLYILNQATNEYDRCRRHIVE